MPDFNKLRFNEPLLGRVIAAKREGTDGMDIRPQKAQGWIMRSQFPEEKFDSFHKWFESIHKDVQLLATNSMAEKKSLQVTSDSLARTKQYRSDWMEKKLMQTW